VSSSDQVRSRSITSSRDSKATDRYNLSRKDSVVLSNPKDSLDGHSLRASEQADRAGNVGTRFSMNVARNSLKMPRDR